MACDGASGIRKEDHSIIASTLQGDLQHGKSGQQLH